MDKQPDTSPDSRANWTDEDVFHAKRRASFRSMVLVITFGTAVGLDRLAIYYSAGSNPSGPRPAKVQTLETLSVCVFVVALGLGLWTLGAWLDYIQRRGGREARPDDPI